MYTMLKPTSQPGNGAWFQTGFVVRGWVTQDCSRFYMQYNDASGGIVTEYSAGQCATNNKKYRFVVYHIGGHWEAYALDDATGAYAWQADDDPATLAWTPGKAEYSSEVFNEADQSGGANSSRALVENSKWYTGTGDPTMANMQGAERFCQFCPDPYNINWVDGNTFEVWTDGF